MPARERPPHTHPLAEPPETPVERRERALRAPPDLAARLPRIEQGTRLVCVEGWSTVAWWAGHPFAALLAAFPPAAGARWASLRSAVNLDACGNAYPYYVSLDLATLRHP